ncbi:RNA polymerase sigma factor [Aurantiacibacter rhizosphaerae]|uniref:Sigma-70 family RNA polymerase sigma factor n=1 Tax=Aurantiacibacter rhizosphaerae TaxID=2691582 RepID=A0A844XDH6_9SPHN|nr:sigma-70 family RNA polymerase sigma factor [Aurantiacibacter rhizosphaerae]MWV27555.1 sigma-70 family RNA polymerase sigma factor [Aurantiacibacter rhizosphaerae]
MVSKEEEKWANFHRDYRPALIAFFLRRTHDYAEAEDLSHEVFIRIADKDDTAFRQTDAYIFQVAANLLRDRGRRSQVRSDYASRQRLSDELGIDPLDPHRISVGRESLALLTSALEELPERTRQIFMLFRYEQIDQRTIAESFGISVSAVEKHVHRAMAKLIKALGEKA